MRGASRRNKFSSKPGHRSRWLNLEALEDRLVLATITVDSLLDNYNLGDAPDGDTTLREAVLAANFDGLSFGDASGGSGADRINFDSSLDDGTIELSHGEIEITSQNSLTIDASGMSLTIDGNDTTPGQSGDGIRIFNIISTSSGSL